MSDLRWALGNGRVIALDRPRLMGIVNVTPDSFSDRGAHFDADAAVAHAMMLVRDGADIIDIGGESTRPGAAPVDGDEQARRVRPVIDRLRRERAADGAAISVDTTSARVAAEALDAGADAVNDVSAGRDDPAMLAIVARRGCGVVLMHRLRPPGDDRYSDRYTQPPEYGGLGVVGVVSEFLRDRREAWLKAGVLGERIALDAGLGFGKSVAQNYELMAEMGAMQRALGAPMLVGASRKSFLGAVSGVAPAADRDGESIAAAVAMMYGGARLFRVHDVAGHRRGLGAAWRVLGRGLAGE